MGTLRSVGSDLNFILVLQSSNVPFVMRGRTWDLTSLPVAADVLVYTTEEWAALLREGRRFAQQAEDTAVWVLERN